MQVNSNYDRYPDVEVFGFDNQVFNNYNTISEELENRLKEKSAKVLVIDCYHGVREQEILSALDFLNPSLVLNTLELKKTEDDIQKLIHRNITADRVFGVMSCHNLIEFFDEEKLKKAKKKVKNTKGLVVIIGVGASLVTDEGLLVYADLARWEIQQRYRSKELDNWGVGNFDEDILRKYKRAFFIEWRVIDRHKKTLFDKIDYLLDTNKKDHPKMITGKAFLAGLETTSKRPFRVVPFFDPAPWGGQWMKEFCGLDKSKPNYGWCFDCVPEENSLLLKYGSVTVEVPSINLVFKHPIQLLGDHVHARFGAEFPIRFDLLDTVGGGHLSFQVHPLTEYIQETFGMHYTQDESYYMLDADDDAIVYLGTKEGVDKEEVIKALEEAQTDVNKPFQDKKYTNQFLAKKHDHFLIPAGTVHCSGSGSMVLEISATPYIFTFKLWDWKRLGLDGKPRPVHLEHGKKVIQWDRDTKWVKDNLINRIEPIAKGDGWREERTGLHEREFIETRRHWFSNKVTHNTQGNLNVLNLVEGREAIVKSPSHTFEPFIIHYAETFIVPASVGEYTIEPYGESIRKECATLKAFVR